MWRCPSGQPSEEIGNTTPYPMFFVPVHPSDEKQIGAILHVWLRAAGDPKTYPTLVTFLNQVCGHAANFLRARQGEVAIARNQEYEQMLRCQGDFVGELDPLKLGRSGGQSFHGPVRGEPRAACSIRRAGKWRLEFASNQETIDQRSELVGQLRALAARLPVGEQPAALSLDAPEQAAEWTDVLEPLGARQVAYTFFQGHPHEGQTGLVVLERHAANAPFTPVALRQLGWAGAQLGRAMLAATTYREVPFRRVLQPVTHARGHVETPSARAAGGVAGRSGVVARAVAAGAVDVARGRRLHGRAAAHRRPSPRKPAARSNTFTSRKASTSKKARCSPSWKTTTCARRWP